MSIASRLRTAASAAVATFRKALTLTGVDSNRGWLTLFSSNRDGTWQSDSGRISDDNIFAYVPIYSCATLIASDIGKICIDLKKEVEGVWARTESASFSPVLRKPNHYQTRQQFIETWVMSKVLHGNTYVLKVRDARKVVVALYVLDPSRVTPLVAPDGSVYYQIMRDDLSKLPGDFEGIPAYEIIHDRMECPFHPLVGVSPLFAAYLPAAQGLRIQKNSERFFRNMSRPSGILSGPGEISPDTAKRIKDAWEENYKDGNLGRIAVVGDDLKYIPMTINAVDAQLVEQLKLSAEQICSAFHVPAYMIGAAPPPAYTNIQALNQQYYSQCLQKLFNAIEDLLDDGLGLRPLGFRTEFDLADLLRMDSLAQAEVVTKLVGGGIMSPDWGRAKFGEGPTPGGDTPYMQEQNWPLRMLAGRELPAAAPTAPAPMPGTEPDADEEKAALEAARLIAALTKGLENV